MEPQQNLSETQSEQEWELSDEELDRSGTTRGTLFPHGTATSASNRGVRPKWIAASDSVLLPSL